MDVRADAVLRVGQTCAARGLRRGDRTDVTERGQASSQLGCDACPSILLGPRPATDRGGTTGHRVCQCPMVVVDVLLLERIAAQVVELGTRGVDQLESTVSQSAQRAPPQSLRILRFGIRLETEAVPSSAHQVHETESVNLWNGDIGEVQDGGHHVRESDDLSDSERRQRRRTNHQRHSQHILVNEDAVVALATLSKRFAVVARDNHNRPIQ